MIEQLLLTINAFMLSFNEYAKASPVIAGIVSIWGLGVISYFFRSVPSKVLEMIIKQSTTSLTLLSSSQSYHEFLRWCDKHNYTDKLRNLKISSGKWGENDKGLKSIGYGIHHIFMKHKFVKLSMERIENQNSSMELDQVEITMFGRSQVFFNNLLNEINSSNFDTDSISVYKYVDSYWDKVVNQEKRNMNTVFLDADVKQSIITHIDCFLSDEKWHVDNGISYQTGILLHGISGGGKTSIIKAIASAYNRELYILSVKNLGKIEAAISELPNNTILLIEDIDCNSVVHKRTDEEPKKETVVDKFNTANLSDILNTMDGIITNHGRILIATTNHVDKIDPALIRSGRFDLVQELGYITVDIVHQFFDRYYPDYSIRCGFKPAKNISPATLQKHIRMNLNNPDKVLSLIEWF